MHKSPSRLDDLRRQLARAIAREDWIDSDGVWEANAQVIIGLKAMIEEAEQQARREAA